MKSIIENVLGGPQDSSLPVQIISAEELSLRISQMKTMKCGGASQSPRILGGRLESSSLTLQSTSGPWPLSLTLAASHFLFSFSK